MRQKDRAKKTGDQSKGPRSRRVKKPDSELGEYLGHSKLLHTGREGPKQVHFPGQPAALALESQQAASETC